MKVRKYKPCPLHTTRSKGNHIILTHHAKAETTIVIFSTSDIITGIDFTSTTIVNTVTTAGIK